MGGDGLFTEWILSTGAVGGAIIWYDLLQYLLLAEGEQDIKARFYRRLDIALEYGKEFGLASRSELCSARMGRIV